MQPKTAGRTLVLVFLHRSWVRVLLPFPTNRSSVVTYAEHPSSTLWSVSCFQQVSASQVFFLHVWLGSLQDVFKSHGHVTRKDKPFGLACQSCLRCVLHAFLPVKCVSQDGEPRNHPSCISSSGGQGAAVRLKRPHPSKSWWDGSFW